MRMSLPTRDYLVKKQDTIISDWQMLKFGSYQKLEKKKKRRLKSEDNWYSLFRTDNTLTQTHKPTCNNLCY